MAEWELAAGVLHGNRKKSEEVKHNERSREQDMRSV